MSLNFRIAAKVGLLLVVFGFCMPIVSIVFVGGMNGFQIADALSKYNAASIATALHILFISAIIGVIIGGLLLAKIKVPSIIDWIPIFSCVASLIFIVIRFVQTADKMSSFFRSLKVNDISSFFSPDVLQIGIYVIILGLIAAVIAQIIAAWAEIKIVLNNLPSDPTKNKLAIASFVLSLISLWGIASIVGLVLGIMGLKSARKGFAFAGVVLSSLGILSAIITLIVTVVVVLPQL